MSALSRSQPPLPISQRVSPAQLTVLVVCVVSVYFVVGFYGKSVDSYRINQRAVQMRKDIARLEARNRELQEKVAYLSTDGYVETDARDKLNLVKPGDRSLVAVPAKPPGASVDGPLPPAEPSLGAPEFGRLADWLAYFFGAR